MRDTRREGHFTDNKSFGQSDQNNSNKSICMVSFVHCHVLFSPLGGRRLEGKTALVCKPCYFGTGGRIHIAQAQKLLAGCHNSLKSFLSSPQDN